MCVNASYWKKNIVVDRTLRLSLYRERVIRITMRLWRDVTAFATTLQLAMAIKAIRERICNHPIRIRVAPRSRISQFMLSRHPHVLHNMWTS